MKKGMTLVLLLLLLVGMLIQPVAAAGMQPSMTASTQTAKPGDTIDFTVSMSSSAACDQFGLQLVYDREVFEVVSGSSTVSAENSDGDSAVAIQVFDKGRGFAVSFLEPVVYSGRVGKFTMRVKADVRDDAYTVSFKAAANNGSSGVDIGSASVTINVVTKEEPKPTEPATEPTEPKPTEHKHTYSNKWSSDKNQHWHECTGCGDKKDVKKHTPGPEAPEKEHQRCTVCNSVIKQALGHTHEYDDEWVFDENRHWRVCECGQKSDIANHSWNEDGSCKKCDAKKPEETQPTEETTTPVETTQPTVETTEPTQPIVTQPTRPAPQPTEPVDEGLNDAQWATRGLLLVAVVILVIVVYFFVAKKRQK